MKKLLCKSVLAAMLTAGIAVPAVAEVPGLSANAGFLSDYYFRGNHLGESSPYAGLDYENSGFYMGTWAVDDAVGGTGNNGLEVDYYFGYGMEHGDFSWSLGFTGYEYTYVEDSETEVGLGLGYKGFSFNYYVGTDNNPNAAPDDLGDHDYNFMTLGWAGDIFGATYGKYDVTKTDATNPLGTTEDDGYTYLELSAGGEVSGFDLGITLGRKFDTEVAGVEMTSGGGEYIFVDIGKSFSF